MWATGPLMSPACLILRWLKREECIGGSDSGIGPVLRHLTPAASFRPFFGGGGGSIRLLIEQPLFPRRQTLDWGEVMPLSLGLWATRSPRRFQEPLRAAELRESDAGGQFLSLFTGLFIYLYVHFWLLGEQTFGRLRKLKKKKKNCPHRGHAMHNQRHFDWHLEMSVFCVTTILGLGCQIKVLIRSGNIVNKMPLHFLPCFVQICEKILLNQWGWVGNRNIYQKYYIFRRRGYLK